MGDAGVYGRAFCIVIKLKGLRGEQFISLSKQRDNFDRRKARVIFLRRWVMGGWEGRLGEGWIRGTMLNGSTQPFTCQVPVLDGSFERPPCLVSAVADMIVNVGDCAVPQNHPGSRGRVDAVRLGGDG